MSTNQLRNMKLFSGSLRCRLSEGDTEALEYYFMLFLDKSSRYSGLLLWSQRTLDAWAELEQTGERAKKKEIIRSQRNNKSPGNNGVSGRKYKVKDQALKNQLYQLVRKIW